MIDRISELLFGEEEQHPLELSRDEHRKKQIELREKRDRLRDRKKQLEEKLNKKKEAYFDARDADKESRAEQLKRDAENVKNELETVQTKLDTVDQMLTTVGNFLNVYELRSLGEDEYWERLREMDRQELIEAFSEEKMEVEDLIGRVDTAATAGESVIEDISSQTESLHSSSDLGWEEEYEQKESDAEELFPEEVEGGKELEEEDLDDLQLS